MVKAVFYLLLFFATSLPVQAQQSVQHYNKYFSILQWKGKKMLTLRKFDRNGVTQFLAVDPVTLATVIIPAAGLQANPLSWEAALSMVSKQPYGKASEAARLQAISLQDAGITHGFPKERGVTLTIDLCPSHKPLDRVIFTAMITAFKQIEKPVPVALSVTGRWMLTHEDDLEWLKGLVKSGDLDITWTDHTYNHHFSPTAPLKVNFLLEPGTDINFEILGTEVAMLQHGLMPSVFFRFPGLVSDQQVVDKVLSYGLLPIGSDAWLAKGQQPNAGSIVLIHGNGNEPVGVKDFIALLKSKQSFITGKQWLMYDLSESVEDEFAQ
ncbi:MAG: polysaccharide deacetylase [Pedobacter sp.]|nr:MAG: polysaccharide deacetylase [Pedobacter sp.]